MKKFTASLVITALVIFLVGFPEVSATESVAKSYFSYNGTNYEFIIVNSGTESSVKIAKSTSETGQIAKLENAMKTEIEEVNQLKSELLNQKSVSSEDLSVIDLILAKNEYLSNPVNFIKKDGKCMSEDDFLNIMKYNEGNQEFIVRYIDKPEVTTAVTTTTPKATTTVATTTPNAITTTVVTTYPQTTTTSNVSTTQESAEIQLIKKIVKEISIKDTIAVGDNSDGNVFLFHAEGGNYAYSLEGTAESLVVKPSKVTAVHIWKYEGSEQPFNLTLPEAPAQFIFRDKSYEYELKEYSKINYSEIIAVAKYVSGVKKQLDSAAFTVAMHDYNLSQTLDEEDLRIMIQAWTFNPAHFISSANEELAWRYLNVMNRLEHNNVVLHNSTDLVPYSYLIPCIDMNSSYKGACWICPVQVIPANEVNQLISDGQQEWIKATDSKRDFVVYRPSTFGKIDGSTWVSVSLQMEHWLFSGYYVQQIDENGNPIQHWIK